MFKTRDGETITNYNAVEYTDGTIDERWVNNKGCVVKHSGIAPTKEGHDQYDRKNN